jgi:hypothetical protein
MEVSCGAFLEEAQAVRGIRPPDPLGPGRHTHPTHTYRTNGKKRVYTS